MSTALRYPSGLRSAEREERDASHWRNLVTCVFTYDALNRLTLKDYPSGSDVYYKYDNYKSDAPATNSWGRLRVMYVGSETSNGRLYEYDDRGRTVKETVKVDGNAYVTPYTYDAMDRVTGMQYPGGSGGQGQYSEGYSYNAIGNLTSKGSVSYTYPVSGPGSVRPHAVTSTSNGGSFGYDANGNMNSRRLQTGGSTYTQSWDYENRLASVTVNSQTTSFVYDGNGALVKQTAYENLAVGLVVTSSGTLNRPGVVTNEDTWADSGDGNSGEFAYTSQ